MRWLLQDVLGEWSDAQLAVLLAVLLGGVVLAAILLLPRWLPASASVVARKLGLVLALPGVAGLLALLVLLAGWLDLRGAREGGFAVGALYVLLVWPAVYLVLPASLLLLAYGHRERLLAAVRSMLQPRERIHLRPPEPPDRGE